MCSGRHRPAGAADQALELSRDDILQHRLVPRQVSDQPLELEVLFLELAQPLHLRWHQPGVFLAPIIVRRFADSCLATYLADGRTVFCLLKHKGDLRLGELRSLQRKLRILALRS